MINFIPQTLHIITTFYTFTYIIIILKSIKCSQGNNILTRNCKIQEVFNAIIIEMLYYNISKKKGFNI